MNTGKTSTSCQEGIDELGLPLVTMKRLLIALVLVTLPSFAQERQFVLEGIEVRNTARVSPQVLVAETTLRAGRAYSEVDIRNAVARLERLPFVFKAGYTIENNVLVISVTEMKPLSFLLDARGIAAVNPTTANDFDYDFTDPTTPWPDVAAGVRRIVGGSGVAHFSMPVLRRRNGFGTNYTAYELGYTRYRLLGTRLFATAIVRSPTDSLGEGTFTPEFIAGLPLTPTQTVTVDVEDTTFRDADLNIFGKTFRDLHAQRTITLTWTYDTTNEPYAPSRGTFVEIAPVYWTRDDAGFHKRPPQFVATATHLRAKGVDLAALHHWELSGVNSVFGGVLAGWVDIDSRQQPGRRMSYQIVKAGYSRALGRGASRSKGAWCWITGAAPPKTSSPLKRWRHGCGERRGVHSASASASLPQTETRSSERPRIL